MYKEVNDLVMLGAGDRIGFADADGLVLNCTF